jgi:hypothetical protein
MPNTPGYAHASVGRGFNQHLPASRDIEARITSLTGLGNGKSRVCG